MTVIKPREDWVVIKQQQYKHPSLYVHHQQTHRGVVVAVGPGRYIRKYITKPHPFNSLGETVREGTFRVRMGDQTGGIFPSEVKVGDTVEYSNYGWEEHEIGGEKYIFTREGSILGVALEDSLEGAQGHSSPDID